jgi:hypothetical protein
MQGQSQLDDAQVRGKMSAGLGDRLDNHLPAVLGKLSQLGVAQPFQVSRTLDPIQSLHKC